MIFRPAELLACKSSETSDWAQFLTLKVPDTFTVLKIHDFKVFTVHLTVLEIPGHKKLLSCLHESEGTGETCFRRQ